MKEQYTKIKTKAMENKIMTGIIGGVVILLIIVSIALSVHFIQNGNEYGLLNTELKASGINKYPTNNLLVKNSTLEKMSKELVNLDKDDEVSNDTSKKVKKDTVPSNNEESKDSVTVSDNDESNNKSTNVNNNSDSSLSNGESSNSSGSDSASGSNSGGTTSSGSNNGSTGSGSTSGGNSTGSNGGGTTTPPAPKPKPDPVKPTIPAKPSIPATQKCGYMSSSQAVNQAIQYKKGENLESGRGVSQEKGYDCISDYSWNGSSWKAMYKYDMPAYIVPFASGDVMVMGNGTIYDY